MPILDRRALNGAGIAVQLSKQKQVKEIEKYYPCLIRASCHTLKSDGSKKSLRALDKEWFSQPMPQKKYRLLNYSHGRLKNIYKFNYSYEKKSFNYDSHGIL